MGNHFLTGCGSAVFAKIIGFLINGFKFAGCSLAFISEIKIIAFAFYFNLLYSVKTCLAAFGKLIIVFFAVFLNNLKTFIENLSVLIIIEVSVKFH